MYFKSAHFFLGRRDSLNCKLIKHIFSIWQFAWIECVCEWSILKICVIIFCTFCIKVILDIKFLFKFASLLCVNCCCVTHLKWLHSPDLLDLCHQVIVSCVTRLILPGPSGLFHLHIIMIGKKKILGPVQFF